MRKLTSLVLAMLGTVSMGTSALLLWPDRSVKLDADGFPSDWKIGLKSTAAPPAKSTVATAEQANAARSGSAKVSSADAPRVFSASQPLTSATALSEAEKADTPVRRLASSRPADEEARRELVRDLQAELKRVGCYAGDINGVWSPSTRKAMAGFTDRVNATLPVEEPDFILLTLVQGHSGKACGVACPAGQLLSAEQKCVPRAVVARAARPAAPTIADAQFEPSAPKAERTQPKSVQARTASAWSSVVSTPQAHEVPAPRPVPAPTPLPGRMAMGAPIVPQTQTIDTSLQRQALAAPTVSDANQASPGTRHARSAKPVDRQERAEKARTATMRLPPAYVTAPRPARVVAAAPMPAYVPQPQRWTKTIFTDIGRMR